MATIDKQMTSAFQMPAEYREFRQRFLGDDAELKRQRPEQHRCVVDALMIRYEDVGRSWRHTLKTFDGHANAGSFENQERPGAGTSMGEVTALVPEARHDRRRAKHDRVDGDGGYQEENRPPPVIGRDFQRNV